MDIYAAAVTLAKQVAWEHEVKAGHAPACELCAAIYAVRKTKNNPIEFDLSGIDIPRGKLPVIPLEDVADVRRVKKRKPWTRRNMAYWKKVEDRKGKNQSLAAGK